MTSSRDGHRIFFRDSLPTNLVPQTPTNKEFEVRVKEKLKGVCAKGYITCGQEVKSITNFFPAVKTWKKVNEVKVVNDIRIAYDASKSGLNNVVFAP